MNRILVKANEFLEHVKTLDIYSNYEEIVLLRDFNVRGKECLFDKFLCEHDPTNLEKDKTCLKNP